VKQSHKLPKKKKEKNRRNRGTRVSGGGGGEENGKTRRQLDIKKKKVRRDLPEYGESGVYGPVDQMRQLSGGPDHGKKRLAEGGSSAKEMGGGKGGFRGEKEGKGPSREPNDETEGRLELLVVPFEVGHTVATGKGGIEREVLTSA